MKFIPPVGGVKADVLYGDESGAADGKSGAGGNENEDFPLSSFSKTVLLWIVDVRLASNAAIASLERVCENDSGGNGTLPGAGDTNEGYGYVVGLLPSLVLPNG